MGVYVLVAYIFIILQKNTTMKNQTSTKSKEISAEEQTEINKINLEQSGLKKEDFKEKQTDQMPYERHRNPSENIEVQNKRVKKDANVVQSGLTDKQGNYYPMAEGEELPEQYKESHKDWVPYKKMSDGSIEF